MSQPRPPAGSPRGARVVGVVLILFALGLTALGLFRILEDRGVTVPARAEVTGTFVEEGFDTSTVTQDICHHQVRFVESPGGTGDVTSGGACKAAVGDVVTVFYDPANPANAEFEGGSYRWGDLIGILILAAVLGLPGWFLVRR